MSCAPPLNSILGFSEILADELYGPLGAPQYKEYAQIIQGSGHKLLRLVNQVLEIARLESRLQPLDLRAEPLEAALDDAVAGLRNERGSRSGWSGAAPCPRLSPIRGACARCSPI